ncbi:EAL domain-containing protein [Citromicrobium bathyomarinum]|uniref:putative bifunctional diguanylate cyclase/phosphodiesterase n=1 Tax=Citromicrobium TaxID=72173 RepID=UPI000225EBB4|nr:EAL domain-containing protein [Citromicrobium sp. JLT1363]
MILVKLQTTLRNWHRLLSGDEISERVRRTLVSTLYTQPISLAVGALNGMVAAVVTAFYVPEPVILVCVIAFSLVAVARVVAAKMMARSKSATTRFLEIVFEVGAFVYAGLFGLLGALVIIYPTPQTVEVMMVANALCFATAICARNAGRPAIALGQMFLSYLPILVACFIEGSIPMLALGTTILLVIPAMASITLNVQRTLRNSIASAETSERLARKMEILAHTDVVTGLHNRAGLNDTLVTQLMAADADQVLALFWLDLDRFKEVNDLLGHQIGDRVLSEVARRLRDSLPEDAGIARFGGDEFVFFCKVRDREDCQALAGRILEQVARPMRFDGERMETSCSMGIALMPDDGIDADRLMQGADLALFNAKLNARGGYCFFDAAMTRELANRREIEAELRLAIKRDELSLFFQPIIDLKTGRIRCFEALLRWFHPTKGELRPGEFIPVAEETGVIVTLGNWITRQAALACAQWPEDVSVAVNLSPLQIRAPGSVLAIEQALRDAKLDPSRLELEVTESLFIEDSDQTAAFIEKLAARGVRFALDDFGTGYSSLAYIHKFPFSKIKVDRSFVSGSGAGPRAHAIIRAVAAMGHQLGMEIVAEGLEEQEQVDTVREAGCTQGQGYFFSRAVPDYLAAMLLAQDRSADATRAA